MCVPGMKRHAILLTHRLTFIKSCCVLCRVARKSHLLKHFYPAANLSRDTAPDYLVKMSAGSTVVPSNTKLVEATIRDQKMVSTEYAFLVLSWLTITDTYLRSFITRSFL